jgi:hypothetical protein
MAALTVLWTGAWWAVTMVMLMAARKDSQSAAVMVDKMANTMVASMEILTADRSVVLRALVTAVCSVFGMAE